MCCPFTMGSGLKTVDAVHANVSSGTYERINITVAGHHNHASATNVCRLVRIPSSSLWYSLLVALEPPIVGIVIPVDKTVVKGKGTAHLVHRIKSFK